MTRGPRKVGVALRETRSLRKVKGPSEKGAAREAADHSGVSH